MKSMLGEMQFNCFSYCHFYIAVNYFLEMFLLLVYLKKMLIFFATGNSYGSVLRHTNATVWCRYKHYFCY